LNGLAIPSIDAPLKSMDLIELMRARQSVRSFQSRPIEPAKLTAVLTAAIQAPSAGNMQAYQMHVVRSEAMRRNLAAAAYGQEFLYKAPLVLVFCADLGRAWKLGKPQDQNFSPQDAIIAMAYAQLAATEVGLGSCWVGAFDERQAAKHLSLPATQRVMALMPIGYAADIPTPLPRRALFELVVDHEA
jgi:nitroreductase